MEGVEIDVNLSILSLERVGRLHISKLLFLKAFGRNFRSLLIKTSK